MAKVYSANAYTIMKAKTADESVTSSTTLQADDHLAITLGVSQVWAFQYQLNVDLGDTGLSYLISETNGAAAATISGQADFFGENNTSQGGITSSPYVTDATMGDNTTFTIANTGFGDGRLSISCLVQTGATGTPIINLKFAQSSSSATAVKMKKGSYAIAHRIS